MARGGIIGYAPGGDVEGESIRERRIRREFEEGQQYLDRQRRSKSEQARQARLNSLYAELNNPEITSEESAALTLELEQLRASQSLDAVEPGGITELKQPQFKTDTRSPQLRPFPQRPSSLIDDSSVGIATGGAAQDTFDPPVGATTAPPFTSVIGDATEAQILAAFGADANAAATTRGDRARELMGLEGLMAERKALQGEARGLREERFSPERMKKRTWRAGLAGLGAKGLGGFGSGATTERDLIDSERAAAAGISLAEVEKMITENRAMGMTQFEAENKARVEVDGIISEGGQIAQGMLATDQQREAADLDRVSRENIASARDETLLAQSRISAQRAPTDTMYQLTTFTNQALRGNPNLSAGEAASEGLALYNEAQERLGLAKLGQTEQANFMSLQAKALEMAIKAVDGQMPPLRGEAREAELLRYQELFVEGFTLPGKTGPTVGTVRDGFRFNGGDPNVRSNWEEI